MAQQQMFSTVTEAVRREMSVEDAIELGKRSIYHATFRDAVSGGTVSGKYCCYHMDMLTSMRLAEGKSIQGSQTGRVGSLVTCCVCKHGMYLLQCTMLLRRAGQRYEGRMWGSCTTSTTRPPRTTLAMAICSCEVLGSLCVDMDALRYSLQTL